MGRKKIITLRLDKKLLNEIEKISIYYDGNKTQTIEDLIKKGMKLLRKNVNTLI
jgi:hypothetical protein